MEISIILKSNPMKKFILVLTVVTLLFISSKSQAQVSVGYYHSNFVSEMSVGTSPEKRFWGEARITTNVLSPDLQVMGAYNFLRKERVRTYIGAGYNTIGGLVIPVGLQVMPFTDFKNFAFQFEVSPLLGELSLIKGGIGFRYTF